MTTRDIWLIGIWALASAGVTTALMMPTALNAVDTPAPKTAADIRTPMLKTNGCEVSVRWLTDARVKETSGLSTTLAAGEMPKFELVAHNPTEEPASFECKVAVWTRDPVSLGARSMPMERDSYSEYSSISLKPGETKTIAISPKAKLVAGASGSIRLTAGGPETAKPEATPVAQNGKVRRAVATGLVVARYSVPRPGNDKTAALEQITRAGSQDAVTKVDLAQVAAQQNQN